MKKGALQFSFGWLFALLVGAIILFLAIYLSTRIIDVGNYQIDSETAKQIEVLLNPLETSFESETSRVLVLPAETRIYNRCDSFGEFGIQSISISQKNFGKWPDPGAEVSFSNKYIFSEDIAEDEKFYVFSKSFNLPFKVADSIILIPSKKSYCFIDAPREIQDDVNVLPENIKFEDCSSSDIEVCFSSGTCDVNVNMNQNYVDKNGEKVYFSDGLIYSAIFSSAKVYECQTKRLVKRVEALSDLYSAKSGFVKRVDCNSGVDGELLQLKSLSSSYRDSGDILVLKRFSDELNQKKQNAECELW